MISQTKLTELVRLYLKSRHVFDPDWSEAEIAQVKIGRRVWIRKRVALLRSLRG